MRTIYKWIIIVIIGVLSDISVYSQAKKPTLMVIPAEAWCMERGYFQTYENQGKVSKVPDYETAFQGNSDLLNVVTKIGGLMADRQFPLKDMQSAIRDINRSEAEDAMTVSRGGNGLAETPVEKLLRRAKADIMVELAWKVNQRGPKKSVTYTLRGIDAYSNKQVAAAQGTGTPSFSADEAVLLEEAVVQHMDNFLAQLQAHFDDMLENGREVVMNVAIFDTAAGLSFDDEFNGAELTDIIDDWMAENTVKHRYSLSDATDKRLSFEQVRIPLFQKNGNAMDTRNFAVGLRKFLSKPPYNIPVKLVTKGLGRVEVILGEK